MLTNKKKVSQKVLKLEYANTKEQGANIFTKPLPKESFEHLRQNMGVIPLQKLYRKKHNLRGRYNDRGSCQKEEIQEILNSITGYPFSLLSKGGECLDISINDKGEEC